MNPIVITRVTRYSMYPLRSVGILARRSSFIRNDFSSFLAGQKRFRCRYPALRGSNFLVASGFRRQFASSASSFSLPTRTFTFFTLSSLGLVGCFYVISYSLQQSNIYKEAVAAVNSCSEVLAITGAPAKKKGMTKGKMKSGLAEMHFVMRGPKGEVIVTVEGKIREGSKTEYDLEKITAENREKEGSTVITIFDDGEFKVDLDQPVSEQTADQPTTPGEKPKETKFGFLLDKPWYYRIGLAIGCGLVLGVLSSVMIMSFRQSPKQSSAYQSLVVLLKENAISKDILGDGIKSAGQMTGKSEENWANFSIKMQGKKSSALVNCQAFRQGDTWRFTVVSLDTSNGRVYLCKSYVSLTNKGI